MGVFNRGQGVLTAAGLAAGLLVAGCSIAKYNPSFEATEDTEQALVLIGFDDVKGKVPPFLRMAWRQIDPATQMPLDENVFVFIDTGSARTFQVPGDSTVYTATIVPAGIYVLESVVASSQFYASAYNAQNWMTGATKRVELGAGDVAYLGRFVFETSLNGRAQLREFTQDAEKAAEVRAQVPQVVGEMTLPELTPFSYECERISWTGVFKRCASPIDAVPKGHVLKF